MNTNQQNQRIGRIFVLQGLPASGKSTLAQKIVKGNAFAVRVNKDSLRQMMFYWRRDHSHFNKVQEKLVQATEDAMIIDWIEIGFDVVVDDTNLNPKRINRLVEIGKELSVRVVFIKVNTGVEECIIRDSSRSEPVGAGVIVEMGRRYNYDISGLVSTSNERVNIVGQYVVCDMDGTLADCSHRLHFLAKEAGNKPNWKNFFAGMTQDALREDVLDIAKGYGLPLVIVSARPDEYRYHTEQWLKKHSIVYSALIMRKGGDFRSDDLVKLEMLDTLLDKDQIAVVIDDRPKVIDAWLSRGLRVINVGCGKDF